MSASAFPWSITATLVSFIALYGYGFEKSVGERGLRCSGGECQRVAIARALPKKPRLLVLDEATASFDSRTEREVQARLDLLARGTTTLVIAHRLSTAGSRPYAKPTGSSCWTAARWSSAAATTNCCGARAFMPRSGVRRARKRRLRPAILPDVE